MNGAIIRDPWHPTEPSDDVHLEGYGLVTMPDWEAQRPRVVLFNKPPGVVTSLRSSKRQSSDLHLKALQDVLPEPFLGDLSRVPALRPVGRLDAQSVGLLLLTDSSQLVNRLTGPESCEKEYLLRVTPRPNGWQLKQLAEGVQIADGKGLTNPCMVSLVQADDGRGVVRFVIHEGRNRQLRQMCRVVGLEVEWLMRTRVGPLKLGSLQLGSAREATHDEVAMVR